MNEQELSLFLDTFDGCIENDRFLQTFYDLFLASSEEVRALFLQTDFSRQKRALKASLYTMVSVVARKEADYTVLAELAQRHRELRIQPHSYDLWLESLTTAAERCASRWDAEIERVWRAAFREAIAYMAASA